MTIEDLKQRQMIREEYILEGEIDEYFSEKYHSLITKRALKMKIKASKRKHK